MQITREAVNPTAIKLTVTATPAEMDMVHTRVLAQAGANVKVAGFRPGKAPAHLIEKQLDQATLQNEFLETIINDLYVKAAAHEKLRAVAPPTINITKFVPYSTLEFSAEVNVLGTVKLPDLRKLALPKPKTTVSAKDVDEVLASLKTRAAEKTPVERASKVGDQVTIDFKGVDAKTDEPISGAAGDDYPLLLGSNTFIPGFEDHLVGLKANESKEFVISFPADYGVAALQKRKVKFTVTIKQVEAVKEPKLDDGFAAKVGDFASLAELKADIKQQLQAERAAQAERDYDNALLETLAQKTVVAIPDRMIEEEIDRIEEEEKRNLVYRGQTWQEHLEQEGVSAEEHRQRNKPNAELRVKAGIVLTEIAEQHNLTVSPEEIQIRISALKGQYTDPAMLAELDKPEAQRELASRLLSEKALVKVKELVV